jgi:hypothetical protein
MNHEHASPRVASAPGCASLKFPRADAATPLEELRVLRSNDSRTLRSRYPLTERVAGEPEMTEHLLEGSHGIGDRVAGVIFGDAFECLLI